MSTFQYIHPSCNLKEESNYTHINRSVDTNRCNPMTNDLKSDLVPLKFNYNAEITYPLGVCNNTLLQIGPVREDHKEEQLWNNYQFKKHYTKNYDKEHTHNEFLQRKETCGAGGRIGCNRREQEDLKDYMVNDINRSEANKAGSVTK
jgi:hypothetical protein